MSRYEKTLEGFTCLTVKQDTHLNKLQVRTPYYLNNTCRKDRQCLAILLSNGFEYWNNVGWVGNYSSLNVHELKRVESILQSERVKHG